MGNLALSLFLVLLAFQLSRDTHALLLKNRPGQRFGIVRPQRPCTLPKLLNGSFKILRMGKMLRFKCKPGYQMIGDKINECVANRWDLDIPVCIKSGCPPLAPPPNGLIKLMHQNASAVLFCNQNFQIAGSVVSYCNGTDWDRSIGSCRETNISPALFCDFETETICDYFHDAENDFDFVRRNGHNNLTVRVLTGPQADHTTGQPLEGHYMVINTKGESQDKKARLISPIFEASFSENNCLKFYYHMYGQSVGVLRVYVAPVDVPLDEILLGDEIVNNKDYLIFEEAGSKANEWLKGLAPIKPVTSRFHIIFEAICGQTRLSDIAIDDISIMNTTCFEVEEVTEPQQDLRPTEEDIRNIQSCASRCNEQKPNHQLRFFIDQTLSCECFEGCLTERTCCPDYADFCGETSTITERITSAKTTQILDFEEVERFLTTVSIPAQTFSPSLSPPSQLTHHKVFYDSLLVKTMVVVAAMFCLMVILTVLSRKAIRHYKTATDPMNYKTKEQDSGSKDASAEFSEIRYLTGADDVELDFALATPESVQSVEQEEK